MPQHGKWFNLDAVVPGSVLFLSGIVQVKDDKMSTLLNDWLGDNPEALRVHK